MMTIIDRYQAGVENSALLRWFRASYLFRWLAAEPEPDVIVIDLRDTYTVGPFIAVLDWCITSLAPAYRHSRLRALGRRLDTVFRTAPIRVVSLGLLIPSLGWLALKAISNPSTLQNLLPPLVLVGITVVGTRITRSLDEVQKNRLVAFLLSALAPREPPADQPMTSSTGRSSTTSSETNHDDP